MDFFILIKKGTSYLHDRIEFEGYLSIGVLSVLELLSTLQYLANGSFQHVGATILVYAVKSFSKDAPSNREEIMVSQDRIQQGCFEI